LHGASHAVIEIHEGRRVVDQLLIIGGRKGRTAANVARDVLWGIDRISGGIPVLARGVWIVEAS
jgi:hypothetical protein